MCNDLNKVILCGRVGNIHSLFTFTANKKLVRVNLATNQSWITPEGERKEKVEWHNLVFFNGAAEYISKELTKGSRLYIEGELSRNDFEKQGTQVIQYEIKVTNFNIIYKKPVQELDNETV